MAVNSPGRGAQYSLVMESGRMNMATIRKGTRRFARWFSELREANRPRYRWYEHDLY
jgi:hypothetical protein